MLEASNYSQFRVAPRPPMIGSWIEGCTLAELDDAGLGDLRGAPRHYAAPTFAETAK